MGPVVLLRADADPAMGTGHVMRVLALAEALADMDAVCHLASAELPDGLAERAGTAGVMLHRLPVTAATADDLAATRALIRDLDPGALVVDGYQFGPSWRLGVAGCGIPVVAFDDLNDGGPLHAGLVINAAPGSASLDYARTAPGARLLLGPLYASLRREIREAVAAPAMPLEERRTLLVTFGGSDPLGLSGLCLDRLAPELEPGERLVVTAGGADTRWASILAAAAAHGDRVEVRRDVRAMGALMAQARLAVAAAGTTTGELAALAVPTVLVVVAGNQEDSARQSERLGWCRVVDGRKADAADRIAAEALTLWRDRAACRVMGDRVRGVVDGQGAVRIASALLDAVRSVRGTTA